MTNCNILLIGCGKQAEKYIVSLNEAVSVTTYVFDIDHERATAFAEKTGSSAVDDVDILHKDVGVNGVVICTPVQSHRELIAWAVERNAGVLCEKPIDTSVARAEEVIALTNNAKLPAVLAMTYRYVPAFQELKALLGDEISVNGESSILGQIKNVVVRIGGRGSHQVWKHLRSSGGGAVNEMLVHMLDMCIWLFGNCWTVSVLDWQQYSSVRNIHGVDHKVDTEDWVVVKLQHKSGFVALVQADFFSPAFSQYIEVQGTNGSFFGSIQNTLPNTLTVFESVKGYEKGVHNPGSITKYLPGEVINDFLSCLKSGTNSVSPLSDGIATQSMVEAVLEDKSKKCFE